MNDWMQAFLNADYGGTTGSSGTVLFVLIVSVTIGQIIGWVYMWTHRSLSYSQSFAASLVVIPMLVSMMMLLMAGSLVFAFGLLAVFAVVRFRNVLKDTRDTSFILWAIMQGLAVGTLKYSTAMIGVLGVSLVFLYLWLTDFGARHRYDAVLNLRLTGDLVSGVATLNTILGRHCIRRQLASDRQISDTGVDLSYRVLMRDPARSAELDWDLRQTEGVEDVSVYLRRDESEY